MQTLVYHVIGMLDSYQWQLPAVCAELHLGPGPNRIRVWDRIIFGSGMESHLGQDQIAFGSETESHLSLGPKQNH